MTDPITTNASNVAFTYTYEAPARQPDVHIGRLVDIETRRLDDGSLLAVLHLESETVGGQHQFSLFLPAEWADNPNTPPAQIRNYLTPDEQARGVRQTPAQRLGRYLRNSRGDAPIDVLIAAGAEQGRPLPERPVETGEQYFEALKETYAGIRLVWGRRPDSNGYLRVAWLAAPSALNNPKQLQRWQKAYRLTWLEG